MKNGECKLQSVRRKMNYFGIRMQGSGFEYGKWFCIL